MGVYVGLIRLPEPTSLNQAYILLDLLEPRRPRGTQGRGLHIKRAQISPNLVEMNSRYRVAKMTPPNAREPSSVALCSLSPKNKGLTPISRRMAFSNTRRRPHLECLKTSSILDKKNLRYRQDLLPYTFALCSLSAKNNGL